MKKLTLLSKSILTIIGILIITTISYFSTWIFHLKDNQVLISLNNSQNLTSSGFYFKNPKNFIKVNSECQHITITDIIQSKDNQIRVITAILYYTYDENWIKSHKSIPTDFNIPKYSFEHYMMNSSLKYSINDLNRELLSNMIQQFFEHVLSKHGYKVVQVMLPYPFFTLDQAKAMHIL